jgi:capsular polysaccharide biosynthesis protein
MMLWNDGEFDILELLLYLKTKILYFLAGLMVGFLFGILYSNFLLIPEYTTTGSFIINKTFNSNMQFLATEIVHSDEVSEDVILELMQIGVTKIDNQDISITFLKENISTESNVSSPIIVVNLKSKNIDASVIVLNTILDSTVRIGNEQYATFTDSLMVYEYAETATYTGTSKSIIVVTSTLLGVAGVFFVFTLIYIYSDIVRDTSYFKNNFKCIEEKNENKLHVLDKTWPCSGIEETVDYLSPHKKNKVICVFSTSKNSDSSKLVDIISDNLVNNSYKVLVLNFYPNQFGQDAEVKDLFEFLSTLESLNEIHIDKESYKSVLNFDKHPKLLELNKFNQFGDGLEKVINIYEYILIIFPPIDYFYAYQSLLHYADVIVPIIEVGHTRKDNINQIFSDERITNKILVSLERNRNNAKVKSKTERKNEG